MNKTEKEWDPRGAFRGEDRAWELAYLAAAATQNVDRSRSVRDDADSNATRCAEFADATVALLEDRAARQHAERRRIYDRDVAKVTAQGTYLWTASATVVTIARVVGDEVWFTDDTHVDLYDLLDGEGLEPCDADGKLTDEENAR